MTKGARAPEEGRWEEEERVEATGEVLRRDVAPMPATPWSRSEDIEEAPGARRGWKGVPPPIPAMPLAGAGGN